MSQTTKALRYALLLAGVAVSPAPVEGQSKVDFIIRKGKDTVAVERVTRDALTLTGDLKQANGVHTEYVANLRADSTVEHLEVSRQGTQGPAAVFSIDLADTLVRASITGGPQPANLTVR